MSSSIPTATTTTTATSTSVFGGDHPERFKWNGGALASDGCVYAAPFEADRILRIDPAGGGTTELVGPKLELPEPASRYKYSGGVALDGGDSVCFVPSGAHRVLRFHVPTGTTGFVGADYSEISGSRWSGGAVGSDGCLYCAPANASRILRWDPSSDGDTTATTTLVGEDLGDEKWKYAGAVASGDGSEIYLIPSRARCLVRYEIATDRCTRIPIDHLVSEETPGGWRGGVLRPDGCVYGIPVKAERMLRYDPREPHGPENPALVGDAVSGYIGAVLAGNGCIYGIPNKADRVFRYDPFDGTTELVGDSFELESGGKWFHGVVCGGGGGDDDADDGATTIVGIPFDHEKVLRIVVPSSPVG